MPQHPNTLLAASESNNSFPIAVIALAIISVGVFFMLTPAQHILRSDRKTARRLYEREMSNSGNEQRAVGAAGLFYRIFGLAIITLGLATLALAFVPTN